MNEPDVIARMLAPRPSGPASIAVIGLSSNPAKPSFYVSEYMQRAGFRILPINPEGGTILGEQAVASLRDLREKPDIVNVFRLPRFIPAIVDEMIALGLTDLWVQQGIVHPEAAATAEAAGIRVVMDRCIMVEHRHGRF